ncbi:MAG: 3-oxoacid CoA-transferase subunit B [Myxococcales bacterium]|nr:3-oxoacid CoA-transferase subunit B [Myxococcales bacterium]
MAWSREQIAEQAAASVEPGWVVNLGIGLPTLIAGKVPAEKGVWFHSENGLLGMGPYPLEGEEDPQLINAGKQTVTVVPGGSTFDSALSFTMIRGGHVDLAVLGAMQVSQTGDLANWSIPGGRTMGVGGAMDLASGAKRIWVLMTHQSKDGEPKLVDVCDFPLTAVGVVDRVLTELGVFEPRREGYAVLALADGVSWEEACEKTAARLIDER